MKVAHFFKVFLCCMVYFYTTLTLHCHASMSEILANAVVLYDGGEYDYAYVEYQKIITHYNARTQEDIRKNRLKSNAFFTMSLLHFSCDDYASSVVYMKRAIDTSEHDEQRKIMRNYLQQIYQKRSSNEPVRDEDKNVEGVEGVMDVLVPLTIVHMPEILLGVTKANQETDGIQFTDAVGECYKYFFSLSEKETKQVPYHKLDKQCDQQQQYRTNVFALLSTFTGWDEPVTLKEYCEACLAIAVMRYVECSTSFSILSHDMLERDDGNNSGAILLVIDYMKSAAQVLSRASYHLGTFLQYGVQGKIVADPQEALYFYKQAKAQGYPKNLLKNRWLSVSSKKSTNDLIQSSLALDMEVVVLSHHADRVDMHMLRSNNIFYRNLFYMFDVDSLCAFCDKNQNDDESEEVTKYYARYSIFVDAYTLRNKWQNLQTYIVNIENQLQPITRLLPHVLQVVAYYAALNIHYPNNLAHYAYAADAGNLAAAYFLYYQNALDARNHKNILPVQRFLSFLPYGKVAIWLVVAAVRHPEINRSYFAFLAQYHIATENHFLHTSCVRPKQSENDEKYLKVITPLVNNYAQDFNAACEEMNHMLQRKNVLPIDKIIATMLQRAEDRYKNAIQVLKFLGRKDPCEQEQEMKWCTLLSERQQSPPTKQIQSKGIKTVFDRFSPELLLNDAIAACSLRDWSLSQLQEIVPPLHPPETKGTVKTNSRFSYGTMEKKRRIVARTPYGASFLHAEIKNDSRYSKESTAKQTNGSTASLKRPEKKRRTPPRVPTITPLNKIETQLAVKSLVSFTPEGQNVTMLEQAQSRSVGPWQIAVSQYQSMTTVRHHDRNGTAPPVAPKIKRRKNLKGYEPKTIALASDVNMVDEDAPTESHYEERALHTSDYIPCTYSSCPVEALALPPALPLSPPSFLSLPPPPPSTPFSSSSSLSFSS